MTNNVAGLNDPSKFHAAVKFARNYDVCMLQETKLGYNKLNFLKQKWGFHEGVYMSSIGSRRGVVTLFSERLRAQQLDNFTDVNGQFLLNVTGINGQNFLFINFYGDPDLDVNAEQTVLRLSDRIEEAERNYEIHHKVLCGDFNFVLNAGDTTSSSRKPRAEAQFAALLNDHDLYDVDVMVNHTTEHTYFRHNFEGTSARYDRWYMTSELLVGAKLKSERRTGDHAPVMVEILCQKRGMALWQFDDRILDNASGVVMVHETIGQILRGKVGDDEGEISVNMLQEFIDYNETSPFELLSEIVEGVRSKMMEVMEERKGKAFQTEKEAINNLIEARRVRNEDNSQANQQQFEDAREKLRLIQSERAAAAEEANYVQYATAGERMTRYHFALMGKGKASREILRINVDGRILEGEEISEYMSEKFSKIARADPEVGSVTIEEYLGELTDGVRKCADVMKEQLDSAITERELKAIVSSMKDQSVPGPKGITNRLLKVMFPLIKSILVVASNKLLFEDDCLLPSWMYHRKVVFILKPGKNPVHEDSYRGLSMLENMFKMFSKVLGDRMAKALKEIQDENQFGFTEGKSCMEPTRSLIDVAQFAKQSQQPLIVISTDLYKAFDSISLEHVERCLRFYEFPENFTSACLKLTRGSMQFEVNGHMSRSYTLDKGTGQGDPKSAYIFNLCVTPLNEFLSKSMDVPRFEVNGTQIPPGYFADDNAMMLKGNSSDAIINVLDKISVYEMVSGLQLNLTKCEFLAINCDEGMINHLVSQTGMKRVQSMKNLGTWINENGEATEEENIIPVLETIKGIERRFNTAGSSPIGRVLYAKFLLGQRYVHRLQNVGLSDDLAEELCKVLRKMTWTRARMTDNQVGMRTHIARDRVAQPVRFGGLALTNPVHQNISIRLSWIRKFRLEYANYGWYVVLSEWLRQEMRPTIVEHMSLGIVDWEKTATALRDKSKFWELVFRAGARIQELAIKHYPEWHMMPVIGSCRSIIVTRASLEYENVPARLVARSGLRTIGQLFKTNEAGHILPNSMKSYHELQEDFYMHNDVWNSIKSYASEVKRRFSISVQQGTARVESRTILESIVWKYRKGNSIVTRMILADERQRWAHGEVPRSHWTYTTRDGISDIDSGSFMAAFDTVMNSELKPSIKWTSMQVLLRTLWTRVKERNARPGVNASCLNCGQADEHTAHMLFECQLMRGILNVVERVINSLGNLNISFNLDSVLFHKITGCENEDLKCEINDVLLVTKHIVYRVRFRENVDRFPTIRMMVLTLIIELQKLVPAKRRVNKRTCGLVDIIKLLRIEMNWD